jgi:hypothetical protein
MRRECKAARHALECVSRRSRTGSASVNSGMAPITAIHVTRSRWGVSSLRATIWSHGSVAQSPSCEQAAAAQSQECSRAPAPQRAGASRNTQKATRIAVLGPYISFQESRPHGAGVNLPPPALANHNAVSACCVRPYAVNARFTRWAAHGLPSRPAIPDYAARSPAEQRPRTDLSRSGRLVIPPQAAFLPTGPPERSLHSWQE